MIRTALIGVSGYAETYLEHLLRLYGEERLDLVAVCIKNPDQCEAQIELLNAINCPIYSSPDEMYASTENIEWCCIPTGIDSHLSLTLQAFENGCHVLLEKPISGSLGDIEKIKHAATEADRLIMIGYQDLYDQEIHAIKHLITEERMGELSSIKVIGAWPRSVEHYSRNHWAGKQKVGEVMVLDSPLHNAFAHFVNLMCFWAGERFETSAEFEQVEMDAYRTAPIETFDSCSFRIKTKKGASLYAWITHACNEIINPKIEIQFAEGKIVWEMDKYMIHGESGYEIKVRTQGLTQLRKAMFDTVLRKLKGQDVFVCGPDQGIAPSHLANILQDSVVIQELKENCLSEATEFGTQLSVNGIEELMKRAYQEEKLFSEIGLSHT